VLFTILRALISSFQAQLALIVEDRGRVVDAYAKCRWILLRDRGILVATSPGAFATRSRQ
jgi:hypothetical protein